MRPRLSRQRDLFEVDQKMSDIPNTQKTLLVNLIERMLLAALADDSAATHVASDKTREVAVHQSRWRSLHLIRRHAD